MRKHKILLAFSRSTMFFISVSFRVAGVIATPQASNPVPSSPMESAYLNLLHQSFNWLPAPGGVGGGHPSSVASLYVYGGNGIIDLGGTEYTSDQTITLNSPQPYSLSPGSISSNSLAPFSYISWPDLNSNWVSPLAAKTLSTFGTIEQIEYMFQAWISTPGEFSVNYAGPV